MIHSPPVSPANQDGYRRFEGGSGKVKVVNSYTNTSDRGFIQRRKAQYLVDQERADWCDPTQQTQIRLRMQHPDNQVGATRNAEAYNAVLAKNDFELNPSRSGGMTVMRVTQAPTGKKVLGGPHRKGGWQQQTRKARNGHSPTVRQIWTRWAP